MLDPALTKRTTLISTLLLSGVFLTGCTSLFWFKDFYTPIDMIEPPPLDELSIGMSKESVFELLGEPYQQLSATNEDGKVTEAFEYIRYEVVPGPDMIERYKLVFVDDALESFESLGIGSR